MNIPTIKLANGLSIPSVGLGLWQIKDQQQFDSAFKAAIDSGYRHFDSAQAYNNEQLLGTAWQNHNLKREELFLTTKIAVQNFGFDKAQKTFKQSLENLKTDYVDLLLLHFPVTLLRTKTWAALELILANGTAKSIGVSNYTIRHLEEMKKYAKIQPVINQIELHVFLQQPDLISYCQDNNIIIEAYSPLAHAKAMDNQKVQELAKKYNKSYAQIMLRYLIQLELVVLPKSITPHRIKENINIFDFNLDDNDVQILKDQDENLRTCWSPVYVP
ncbi:MAG: aldo/keto reductase [Candidatus Saccharimonadales bacterium]